MKNRLLIIVIVLILIVLILTILKRRPNLRIKKISYLNYSYTVGNYSESSINYILKCDKFCVVTIKNVGERLEDAKNYEVDNDFVNDIEDILNKYKVGKWNNFKKSDKRVLDGNSFDLCIKADNVHIDASGYMKWPKNYNKVKNSLNSKFKSLK